MKCAYGSPASPPPRNPKRTEYRRFIVESCLIPRVVSKSKVTPVAWNLGAFVKDFELSIVKRQRESEDVPSLRQNAAMETPTRDPFPHAIASTAVSLSGPWHSATTTTSNSLYLIVLLNLVTQSVLTMDRRNGSTHLVNRCMSTANSISFCWRFVNSN